MTAQQEDTTMTQQIKAPDAAHLGHWESFSDASYYDMWCVRQVHDREFGHGFHLVNGDEAARLRDFLNTRAHQPDSALVDELRKFKPHLPDFGFDTIVSIPEALFDRILTALEGSKPQGGE